LEFCPKKNWGKIFQIHFSGGALPFLGDGVKVVPQGVKVVSQGVKVFPRGKSRWL